MLYLQNLRLAFGGRTLFDGLTWAVRPGARVALVGPNGAGKSTLLRAIGGAQGLDGGQVVREGPTTVGYLSQDVQEMDLDRSPLEEAMHAFDDVLALEAEERALVEAMEADHDHASAQFHALLERFERVHSTLVAREAHTARPRTESVLSGLGFSVEEMARPLRQFSGGWRMRVALARILLQQPTILLLDEPTNHLDIESIDWLEGYLKQYPGAVVLVSHDRYFLDRMTTATAELHAGLVTEYAGNYSYYLEAREERRTLQQAAYDNQQKLIADTEQFITRFRAKASKATQVQSRVKQLDKLERVAPPPTDAASIRFRFPVPPRSGRAVVELTRFSKGYPAPEGGMVSVFENTGPLVVERGDKVALVGKNGAGKSTLARMLIGTEPFEGTRQLGYGVVFAHFAQHQAEAIEGTQSVLDAIREVSRGQSETELRSLLGAFLFQGDDAFKPVSVLSGGEKSRLALARTLLSPANFLVLDEPTNHLDMASKAVLVEALRQYTGAFVVVSHDRYFLDQTVNRVWYAEDRGVRQYVGSYTDAHWQRTHGTAAQLAGNNGPKTADRKATVAAPSGPSASSEDRRRKTKEEKRAEAEARNAAYRTGQRAPSGDGSSGLTTGSAAGAPAPVANVPTLSGPKLHKALAAAEKAVAAKEVEKAELEAKLADSSLYGQPAVFSEVMARHAAVEGELTGLYAKWEALAAQAEAA